MDLVRHGTSRAAPSWTWTLWTPRAQFRRGLRASSLATLQRVHGSGMSRSSTTASSLNHAAKPWIDTAAR